MVYGFFFRRYQVAGMSELGDLMREISKRTGAKIENVIIESGIKMTDSIMAKSPVDTGRFRGSWIATSSRPSRNQKPRKRSERAIKSEAIAKLTKAIEKQTTFYIVNNLPYANVIEYGLYPKNVKKGTRNRKTKRFEIRTVNGFSRQAPAGLVRVTAKEYKRDLKRLIEKLRNKK